MHATKHLHGLRMSKVSRLPCATAIEDALIGHRFPYQQQKHVGFGTGSNHPAALYIQRMNTKKVEWLMSDVLHHLHLKTYSPATAKPDRLRLAFPIHFLQ